MLWHSPLPTSTHQFIHCNIYKTQRITLNNINHVMLPIIVHFKARNSSWVMPKNHLPLSMKVVILRCQYFGLDQLLPVSVGSSCRQEICSFPPSLGLAVRLPGCFLCPRQMVTVAPGCADHCCRSQFTFLPTASLYDPSSIMSCFPWFHVWRSSLLNIH